MGLPYVNITFKELGISAIRRGDKGVVAMVLYDEIKNKELEDVYEIRTINEIPEKLSDYNKKQIQLAFLGYITAPKKVYICLEEEGELVKKGDIEQGVFDTLENLKWDILTVPGIQGEEVQGVIAYIKSLNDNEKRGVIAVLPHANADDESIVNYVMPEVTNHLGETFVTEDYCARIAGLIAGTPLTISCTYARLPELASCTNFKRGEIEKKIDNGQFVLMNDGEKIKVARGITSLTTIVQDKRDSFKKIKLVQAMHLIRTDIKKACEDNYIGKYANSYDNKVLLSQAILGYFQELERVGIAERGESDCRVDLEGQRNYLKSTGYKTKDGRTVEDMEEIEILYGDTDDKVFLEARVKLLDAIEEIELPIEI